MSDKKNYSEYTGIWQKGYKQGYLDAEKEKNLHKTLEMKGSRKANLRMKVSEGKKFSSKPSIWLCDECFLGDDESNSKVGWCNEGGLPFKSLDYPIKKCSGFKPITKPTESLDDFHKFFLEFESNNLVRINYKRLLDSIVDDLDDLEDSKWLRRHKIKWEKMLEEIEK